jgi:RimJ/RimL family protein N-acetyltransferase
MSGQGGKAGGGIEILPYDPAFENDLIEICWETGLMGESLSGTGRFDDKRLFAMLFALPWAGFEPAICRLAVAGSGKDRKAVGYIIGTTDAKAMGRHFARHWMPRIAARVLLLDWWLHPESARQVMRFYKASRGQGGVAGAAPEGGRTEAVGPDAVSRAAHPSPSGLGGPDWPAELHINLLPGWQGQGLGGRLMEAYLAALRERNVPGVFLETSSRNLQALPFYERLGFSLVADEEVEPGREFWIGLPARSLTYAMRLGSPGTKEPAGPSS